MTPVQKIQNFIENAMANNDQSVYDLLQFVRQLRQEETDLLAKFYKSGADTELNLFRDDINEFLDTHLDAIEIVTTYQKETEYLLGFQQALKMFRNEFEFILTPAKPIDDDEEKNI